MFANREDLVRAAYCTRKITCSIDFGTGEIGSPETEDVPDGKFLNRLTPGGTPLKPDGLPAFTRVSAIVCIEERIAEKHPPPNPLPLAFRETCDEAWRIYDRELQLHLSRENEAWIEHDVLVLHNPNARMPLPGDLFADFHQFVRTGDTMAWSDGCGRP